MGLKFNHNDIANDEILTFYALNIATKLIICHFIKRREIQTRFFQNKINNLLSLNIHKKSSNHISNLYPPTKGFVLTTKPKLVFKIKQEFYFVGFMIIKTMWLSNSKILRSVSKIIGLIPCEK